MGCISKLAASVANLAWLGSNDHRLVVRLRHGIKQLKLEVSHEDTPDGLDLSATR